MIRSTLLALCLPVSAGVITVPDPSSPLPEGETVVWSPLFQATWDAMNKENGGKPEKIEPPNELMARLDAFDWKADAVMPEGAWKTWAGIATPDFLNRVNMEAAQMTGEAEGAVPSQWGRDSWHHCLFWFVGSGGGVHGSIL